MQKILEKRLSTLRRLSRLDVMASYKKIVFKINNYIFLNLCFHTTLEIDNKINLMLMNFDPILDCFESQDRNLIHK